MEGFGREHPGGGRQWLLGGLLVVVLLGSPGPAHALGVDMGAVVAAVEAASKAITGYIGDLGKLWDTGTHKLAQLVSGESSKQNELAVNLHRQQLEQDINRDLAKYRTELEDGSEITQADCLRVEKAITGAAAVSSRLDTEVVETGVGETTRKNLTTRNPTGAAAVTAARHAGYCTAEEVAAKLCDAVGELQGADVQANTLDEGPRVGREGSTYDAGEGAAADAYVDVATGAGSPPLAPTGAKANTAKGQEYRVQMLQHSALLSGVSHALHAIKARRMPQENSAAVAETILREIHAFDEQREAELRKVWARGISWIDQNEFESEKRVDIPDYRVNLIGQSSDAVMREIWDINSRTLYNSWAAFKELEQIRQLLALQLSQAVQGIDEKELKDSYNNL